MWFVLCSFKLILALSFTKLGLYVSKLYRMKIPLLYYCISGYHVRKVHVSKSQSCSLEYFLQDKRKYIHLETQKYFLDLSASWTDIDAVSFMR